MATATSSETRIMRLPEVLYRVGIGKSTLYKLIAAGEFPAPVKLTANSVGWLSSDVDAWIAGRQRTSLDRRK